MTCCGAGQGFSAGGCPPRGCVIVATRPYERKASEPVHAAAPQRSSVPMKSVVSVAPFTFDLTRYGRKPIVVGIQPDQIFRQYNWSGSNSGVECQLPKLDVAGSNPVSRSTV